MVDFIFGDAMHSQSSEKLSEVNPQHIQQNPQNLAAFQQFPHRFDSAYTAGPDASFESRGRLRTFHSYRMSQIIVELFHGLLHGILEPWSWDLTIANIVLQWLRIVANTCKCDQTMVDFIFGDAMHSQSSEKLSEVNPQRIQQNPQNLAAFQQFPHRFDSAYAAGPDASFESRGRLRTFHSYRMSQFIVELFHGLLHGILEPWSWDLTIANIVLQWLRVVANTCKCDQTMVDFIFGDAMHSQSSEKLSEVNPQHIQQNPQNLAAFQQFPHRFDSAYAAGPDASFESRGRLRTFYSYRMSQLIVELFHGLLHGILEPWSWDLTIANIVLQWLRVVANTCKCDQTMVDFIFGDAMHSQSSEKLSEVNLQHIQQNPQNLAAFQQFPHRFDSAYAAGPDASFESRGRLRTFHSYRMSQFIVELYHGLLHGILEPWSWDLTIANIVLQWLRIVANTCKCDQTMVDFIFGDAMHANPQRNCRRWTLSTSSKIHRI